MTSGSDRDRLDWLEDLNGELKGLLSHAEAAYDATRDRDELSDTELEVCHADSEAVWKGLKRLIEITQHTIDRHKYSSHKR